MMDDASGANWKFKATNNGGFKIRDHANGLDVFVIEPNSSANALYIKGGGNIGMGTSSPDNSAIVDMSSSSKGFLPPRVALTALNSANPITSPATGLLVCNTATTGTSPNNVIPGYYYWNGIRWLSIAPAQGTNPGDMLYWNGTQWIIVAAGSPGQFLQLSLLNVPTWSGVAFATLTTTSVSLITATTATSGGNITNDGGAAVTARGVCWSTSSNPTTADSYTTDGSGTGEFISNLTGLTSNTLYYVKAYAQNTMGTAYGDQVSFTTLFLPVIGQTYGGGVVFYIDGTGQHGLIAATSNQSTGAPWGCSGTLIGTSTAIGSGQANTTAIVNGCITAGIAARLCDDLDLNGYTDWFLPSKDELNQMYVQKNFIPGFVGGWYFSSSEASSADAYMQDTGTGEQTYVSKNYQPNVRAVRAF
jgi:hypothetical protein